MRRVTPVKQRPFPASRLLPRIGMSTSTSATIWAPRPALIPLPAAMYRAECPVPSFPSGIGVRYPLERDGQTGGKVIAGDLHLGEVVAIGEDAKDISGH